MTHQTESSKLPKWLKVTLIVSGVVLFLIFGSIAGCTFLAINLAHDAKDPAKMKAVAASIMTFRGPLPAGFELSSASDIGLKTVTITNSKDNLEIVISKDSSGLQKGKTSKELVDKYLDYKSEVEKMHARLHGQGNTFNLQSQIVKRGSKLVGHRLLEYGLYRLKDRKSDFVKSVFVGYFPQKDNALVSINAESKHADLDLNSVMSLLSDIESI